MIQALAVLIAVGIFLGTNALYNTGGAAVEVYFTVTSTLFVIKLLSKALVAFGAYLAKKGI